MILAPCADNWAEPTGTSATGSHGSGKCLGAQGCACGTPVEGQARPSGAFLQPITSTAGLRRFGPRRASTADGHRFADSDAVGHLLRENWAPSTEQQAHAPCAPELIFGPSCQQAVMGGVRGSDQVPDNVGTGAQRGPFQHAGWLGMLAV